jgi:hypothetical protein
MESGMEDPGIGYFCRKYLVSLMVTKLRSDLEVLMFTILQADILKLKVVDKLELLMKKIARKLTTKKTEMQYLETDTLGKLTLVFHTIVKDRLHMFQFLT